MMPKYAQSKNRNLRNVRMNPIYSINFLKRIPLLATYHTN